MCNRGVPSSSGARLLSAIGSTADSGPENPDLFSTPRVRNYQDRSRRGGVVHDDWCEDPTRDPNRYGYTNCNCQARLGIRQTFTGSMTRHQAFLTQLDREIGHLKHELRQLRKELRTLDGD